MQPLHADGQALTPQLAHYLHKALTVRAAPGRPFPNRGSRLDFSRTEAFDGLDEERQLGASVGGQEVVGQHKFTRWDEGR
ncbi:hypothetical protein [Rhodoferax ferrireducens]|uniref:hypothetical protein n=1 Tax=Rhodoferax ferrireducens TaxID=192843 RepID=UPI001FC8C89E|nr:hypothetical protein [Rhodoferax ferrireducens]